MKKVLSALLAVLILVSSVEAAIVKSLPNNASVVTATVVPDATATVSPKPVKKMSFVQKLVNKAAKPFESGKS